MKKLMNSVQNVVDGELKRANESFPPFNSRHEGIAIIAEEVLETSLNFHDVEELMVELQTLVFTDAKNEELEKVRQKLENYAKFLACEAIQVSAMAKKFKPLIEESVELIIGVHNGGSKRYKWHNAKKFDVEVGDIVLVETSLGRDYARVVAKTMVPMHEAQEHKEVLNVWK